MSTEHVFNRFGWVVRNPMFCDAAYGWGYTRDEAIAKAIASPDFEDYYNDYVEAGDENCREIIPLEQWIYENVETERCTTDFIVSLENRPDRAVWCWWIDYDNIYGFYHEGYWHSKPQEDW